MEEPSAVRIHEDIKLTGKFSWSDELRTWEWVIYIFSSIILIVGALAAKLGEMPELRFYFSDLTYFGPLTTSSVSYPLLLLVGALLSLVFLVVCEWAFSWKESSAENPFDWRVGLCAGLRLSLADLSAQFVVHGFNDFANILYGRYRPDFGYRCFGGVSPATNYSTSYMIGDEDCTYDNGLRDGRQSFPSGHTSSAMEISFFVTLYLFWRAFSIRERWLSSTVICASILPFIIPIFIGATRFVENRHHISDIIGGMLIALIFTPMIFIPTVVFMGRDVDAKVGRKITVPNSPSSARGGGSFHFF